jgi:hypothetical protein
VITSPAVICRGSASRIGREEIVTRLADLAGKCVADRAVDNQDRVQGVPFVVVGASGSGMWEGSDPAQPVPLGQPLTGAGGDVQSVAISPVGPTLTSPREFISSVTFSLGGNLLAAGSRAQRGRVQPGRQHARRRNQRRQRAHLEPGRTRRRGSGCGPSKTRPIPGSWLSSTIQPPRCSVSRSLPMAKPSQ